MNKKAVKLKPRELYRFSFKNNEVIRDVIHVDVKKVGGLNWYSNHSLCINVNDLKLESIANQISFIKGDFYYYTLDKNFSKYDYLDFLRKYISQRLFDYYTKLDNLNKTISEGERKMKAILDIMRYE